MVSEGFRCPKQTHYQEVGWSFKGRLQPAEGILPEATHHHLFVLVYTGTSGKEFQTGMTATSLPRTPLSFLTMVTFTFGCHVILGNQIFERIFKSKK